MQETSFDGGVDLTVFLTLMSTADSRCIRLCELLGRDPSSGRQLVIPDLLNFPKEILERVFCLR